MKTYRLAALFTLIGLALFIYKSQWLNFPITPNETVNSWHIEAKLEFEADDAPVKVDFFIPKNTENYAIVDEHFISDGYGIKIKDSKHSNSRVLTWTKRLADEKQILFYRAILYEVVSASGNKAKALPIIQELFYQSPEFKALATDTPSYMALNNLIQTIEAQSSDDHSFVEQLLALNRANDTSLKHLKNHFSEHSSAGLLAKVLNHAGIPAKTVHGLQLQKAKRDAKLTEWIEYVSEKKWHRAFLHTDATVSPSPKYYLRWWQGEQSFFQLEGGEKPQLTFAVKQHTESALTEALWQGNPLTEAIYALSIFSLPIDMQLVFFILLLIPIGCLMNAFLRQMIGIKTFGTFMPVLIAIAFRETNLQWGLLLFGVIVTLGFFCRRLFDQMQLLMIPRLAAILTLVVIIMYALSFVVFEFGISVGLSISLFPIVVLTMIIERISVMWEEYGAREALITLAGSLFSAILCYLVMTHNWVTHLFITFPELLLVILALMMLLGRYNGYKLIEYFRFKAIQRV